MSEAPQGSSQASPVTKKLNEKLREGFSEVRQLLKKRTGPIPYMAVFTAATPISFPANFSMAEFPGLLFCHILRGGASDRMVTYWCDETNFRAQSSALLNRVAASQSCNDGFVFDLKRRKTSIWKFWELFSPKDWILTIAAVIGGILGIRDYLAVLVATPDVAISYPDSGRVNVEEGQQISIPVTVWSQVRFAPVKVSFSSTSIQGQSTTKQLDIDTGVLANLPSGQSAQVKITGTAPQHSKTLRSPDVYSLSVTASAKAGILWPGRQIHAPNREVWIWRAVPTTPPPTVLKTIGQVCEVKGLAYVSKPSAQGLDAEFVLNSPPDAITGMSTTNGVASVSSANTKSTTTWKLTFRTAPIERFQEYQYNLILDSSRLVSQADCQSWATALDVSFQIPTGEK